jgi:hypothetical protein
LCGRCTFPACTSGETAAARATFDPSGSIGIKPGTVRRNWLMTAGPFALSSMSFAIACGQRLESSTMASQVVTKSMRAWTWSSR